VKAIFGGNFNPVHTGHLIQAIDALNLLSLEKILFIPAWKAPLKEEIVSVSFEDRYNMLKSATSNISYFEVLKIESKRKGISYSYDTIKELLKKEKELCLLIGEDQAMNFTDWNEWQKILQSIDVYVLNRSNNKIKYLKELKPLNTRIIEISSTEIRNKIKKGEPVDFLVPKEVLNYIKKHKLYKK
jgi:nicotinate-nucleotide adenylyltransferase